MRTQTDQERLDRLNAMFEKAARGFPDVPPITPEDLKQRLARDEVVLVDVRTPQEQAVSMIPGAITTEQFEENAAKYDGRTVVTYCTIGGRSGMYGRDLKSSGFKGDVFNLQGAILAWTHAGGELVNADGPTKKVHTHGRKFSLAAEGYEAVW